MHKLSTLALAALFTTFAAQAADPVVATPAAAASPAALPPAKVVPATPPAQKGTAPDKAAVAPQKTAALSPQSASQQPVSQQQKMRDCNKQATGQKGAERKTYMKSCLSKKA